MPDFLARTTCRSCGDAIADGEYRVVVAVAAWQRDFEGGGHPERGHSYLAAFCDKCVSELPKLQVPNAFKHMVELDSRFYLAPSLPGCDALDGNRAISGHGGNSDDLHSHGDDEVLGGADREANEFPTNRVPWQDSAPEVPLNIRPLASVRRQTLRRYLSSPKSRGQIAPNARKALKLFVDGCTQREIAHKVGIDQATVSRMLQSALKLATG